MDYSALLSGGNFCDFWTVACAKSSVCVLKILEAKECGAGLFDASSLLVRWCCCFSRVERHVPQNRWTLLRSEYHSRRRMDCCGKTRAKCTKSSCNSKEKLQPRTNCDWNIGEADGQTSICRRIVSPAVQMLAGWNWEIGTKEDGGPRMLKPQLRIRRSRSRSGRSTQKGFQP